MIGENVLRLNDDTVMQAIEEYLNRRALLADHKVDVQWVAYDAEADLFEVCVNGREGVEE